MLGAGMDNIMHRDLLSLGCMIEGERNNAMKSEEQRNFENLLRRVVSVPHAEVKRRMEDEKITKQWGKENGQRTRRARPIVSLAAVSESKNRA